MHISIEPLQSAHSDELVRILNEDEILLESLGSRKRSITCEFFEAYNREWSGRTSSKMFAIVLEGEVIGLISLSHINREAETANIDYWFASKHWGKGFADQAFGIVLGMARREGIRCVSCSVPKANQAPSLFGRDMGLKCRKTKNFTYLK